MLERTRNRTEPTMVRLAQPVRQELEAIAIEERRSVSAVINGVITDWLIARAATGENHFAATPSLRSKRPSGGISDIVTNIESLKAKRQELLASTEDDSGYRNSAD
jgi:hypothetical protein